MTDWSCFLSPLPNSLDQAINQASCKQCLQTALLPSQAFAAQLQPTPLYALDWSLRQQALLAFAQARWHRSDDGAVAKPAEHTAADGSILSQLLLQYLGQPASAPAGLPAAGTPTPQCDPRFLSILHRGLASADPLSIDLSASEEPFYASISRLGVEALRLAGAASPSGSTAQQSLLATAGVSATQLRETMMRYWLGRGGVEQCLEAASFLLRHTPNPTEERLHLRDFLARWTSLMRASSRTVLRVSRSKHLTQVPAASRLTKLVCSTLPLHRTGYAPSASGWRRTGASSSSSSRDEPAPTRRWDYEDDSAWSRIDDRVCLLLEEAYQAGRPSVEFQLDPSPAALAAAAASGAPLPAPTTYRADLLRMTQRNLSTGRERAIRCLLALLIKENGGRVSHTVEINMPHDTLIRDLRTELASYLRHDEKLLRMTYAHRVLRRVDFENATIRAAIVPLGAEALTVTKLAKGDMEELCTFTLTGAKPVKQPLFECDTCGLTEGAFMCAVCAQQCHRGHVVRPVSASPGSSETAADGSAAVVPARVEGFCCCGAGAGSDESPCRSLEELPDENGEAYFAPHMALSPRGDFAFVLSTEHGLMKIGTGGGKEGIKTMQQQRRSVTGQLYAQNAQMAAHAGAQLVCVPVSSDKASGKFVLLMRSPVLGANVLLHIDPDTLQFTDERTLLPNSAGSTGANGSEFPLGSSVSSGVRHANDSNSWKLEWRTHDPDAAAAAAEAGEAAKGDVAAAAAAAAAAPPVDEHGQPLPVWMSVSPALVVAAKSVLCSNWSWGTVVWPGGVVDPSLPSLLLEEDGMVLRMPAKFGVKRTKVRVRHAENVQPLFFDDDRQQLQVLNLVPLPASNGTSAGAASSSSATASSRPSKRREHGLALDVFKLPEQFGVRDAGTVAPYCRRCMTRLPEETATQAPPAPCAVVPCAACDAAAAAERSAVLGRASNSAAPAASSSSSAAVSAPAASSSSSAMSAEEAELESKLHLLCMLGVPRSRAVQALQFAQGDLDAASNALLGEMEAVQLAAGGGNGEAAASPRSDDDGLSEAEEELRMALAFGEAEPEADPLHSSAARTPQTITPHLSPSPSVSASPMPSRVNGATVTDDTAVLAAAALARTTPAGDRFYAHALASGCFGSGPFALTAAGQPPLLLRWHHAQLSRRVTLDIVVDTWNKEASNAVAGTTGNAAAKPSTPAKTLVCDGCGSSGLPLSIGTADGAGATPPSSSSLSRLSVCLDRACAEQVVLCKFCQLMGHWTSTTHRASHQMQRVPGPVDESTAAAPTPQRLTLGEYATYLDTRKGVLVVLRDGRDHAAGSGAAAAPSASSSSSAHLESCTLFDVSDSAAGGRSGLCLARQIQVATRGDCYAMDSEGRTVWAYSAATARLERWQTLQDSGAEPLEKQDAANASVSALDAAALILRSLPCLFTSPSAIATGMHQLLQLVEHAFGPAGDALRAHPTLVRSLLLQVRAYLQAWKRHALAPAPATAAAPGAEHMTSCLNRLKAMLLQALALHLPVDVPERRSSGRGGALSLSRRGSRTPVTVRGAVAVGSGRPHRNLFPADSPEDSGSGGAATPPLASPDPASGGAEAKVSWPADHASAAVDMLVEGFELFFPSWKARAGVLGRLMDSVAMAEMSAGGLVSDSDTPPQPVLGQGARVSSSIPQALLMLRALAERYRASYMGLDSFVTAAAPSAAPSSSSREEDATLLSPFVQKRVHLWVELCFEHELAQAERMASSKGEAAANEPHALAFVVLSYQAQLLQLVSLQNRPASVGGSSSSSLLRSPRLVRAANIAFLKLSTLVFQQCVELLRGVEAALKTRQQQRSGAIPAGDSNAELMQDAALAEATLAHVHEGCLGAMVSWSLLSLSELRIDQLALAGGASSATNAQLITQFLRQTMALLCALGGLQSRALQVSYVAQDGAWRSNQGITSNGSRIRLGNTRAKVAALCQSGQLLSLQSLSSVASLATSSASRAPASATPSKRPSRPTSSNVPSLPYVLTPAAMEVFVDLFFEFCSARSGYASLRVANGDSNSSAAAPAAAPWGLGRAGLLRSDLALLFRKRGAHKAEVAVSKAVAAFTRYGMRSVNTKLIPAAQAYLTSAYGSALAAAAPAAAVCEGDEASALSLPAFLQLMTDSCVESPRRVLRDLRVLELRHHFLSTHSPALLMHQDAKVAFAHVLQRLFALPTEAGAQARIAGVMQLAGGSAGSLQLLPSSLAATAATAAAEPPTFAQVLLSRSIEELVNIPPGSKQMSESLRAVARSSASSATRAAAAAPPAEQSALASLGPDVLMKLLSSQENWKHSRAKVSFLAQFLSAPLEAPPPQHLPAASPVANLTPMLRHEVAAEELTSSLVGESSVAKHGAAALTVAAQPSAFSDTAASERLSTLFQNCLRELSVGIQSNFVVHPHLDAAAAHLSPPGVLPASNSKSLLAAFASMSGDRTPPSRSATPPGVPFTSSSMSAFGALPASAALFLAEKLFALALIKHNGLTDACIAYARSLELYRLLASKQTKNVRLLHQQALPEWFKKIVRAVARFVRQPVLDLLRKHREAQHEEAARRAALAKAKKSTAISETSGSGALLERKQDDEGQALPTPSPPRPVASAPSTPAHHRLAVDVAATQQEDVLTFPSVTLYEMLDRWIANCEFLLGPDLRAFILPAAPGAGTPLSRSHSTQASPLRPSPPPAARSQSEQDAATGQPVTSELVFPPAHNNMCGADADDEEDTEDEESPEHSEAPEDEGGLLLRRVQSDLFGSPTRGAAASSMAHISSFELGTSAASVSAQTTPSHQRRLSDSDLQVPLILSGIAGGTGGANAIPSALAPGDASDATSGLSSWTSTTVRPPTASSAAASGEEDAEEAATAAGRTFEVDWLAKLMSSEQRLSDSIGFSVRFLTVSMANRVALLRLVNAAFQAEEKAESVSGGGPRSSGESDALVDDVLPLLWRANLIRDMHRSHGLRASNQGDALLFFYKTLSAHLSKLSTAPELSSSAALTASLSGASSLGSLSRTRLRTLFARVQSVLQFFSLDASPSDADLVLGSGMLTVLPRVVARMDHAQAAHQKALHAQLYQIAAAHEAHGKEPVFEMKTASVDGGLNTLSLSAVPVSPRPSVPSASSLWLMDESTRLSSTAQRWSTHVFMYLSSFLLGLPVSRHTAQQRYVLASTVSRQLNVMCQDHIRRIQRAMLSGFTFTGALAGSGHAAPAPPNSKGRVRAVDMPELGVFPLQPGNPLQAGQRALDELVFRTVDMLHLLARVAAGPAATDGASQSAAGRGQARPVQEHSVCSRKHILFFLRVLRADEAAVDEDGDSAAASDALPPLRSFVSKPRLNVALPSIVQLAIIHLLKRELPYHAPVVFASGGASQPASAPSSALNSPARKVAPSTPSRMVSGFFMPSPSPSLSPPCASPPPSFTGPSALFQRTPSTLAEDAAFSGVDLAQELLHTVAAMQSQQAMLHLTTAADEKENGPTQTTATSASSLPPLLPPIKAAHSWRLMDDASSSGSRAAASSAKSPEKAKDADSSVSPSSAKEHARQASFRRMAVLVCPSCRYIEFPVCGRHKVFLTRQTAAGAAACPDESCSTSTANGSQWSRCLSCHELRTLPDGQCLAGLSWWLISSSEGAYAATASKVNTSPIIPHNVFTCPTCGVAEFPGTKSGGLTLNNEGRLYDAPTKRFLETSSYRFTHFAPSCTGTMVLTPVRMAKEEAACLGRFIDRTPPIDMAKGLDDFGPGKGSTLTSAKEVLPTVPEGASTPVAVLSKLLDEPQAYQSWRPTEQGRACAAMEMTLLVRSFLNLTPAEAGATGITRAASSIDVASTSSSISTMGGSLPASIKAQWRDSLLPLLRHAYFDSVVTVSDFTSPSTSASAHVFAAAAPRMLRAMLAMQILGGLPESLHNGSRVQVHVDGAVVTGVVQAYDPLLSSVSVAVRRQAAGSTADAHKDAASLSNGGSLAGAASRSGSSADASSSADLIAQLGLQSDQESSGACVLEFRLDQVVPITPSPPPPLTVLGSLNDILAQASQLLSVQPATTSPEPAEGVVSKGSARALRHSLSSLLVSQLQQQLLLVLHLHLPSWLSSSSGTPLSREVLSLLGVALRRWEATPAVAGAMTLHPQEWASRARLLSQLLVDRAWQVADPLADQRVPLLPQQPAQVASPSSASRSAAVGVAAVPAASLSPAQQPDRRFPERGQAVRVSSGPSRGAPRFHMESSGSEEEDEDDLSLEPRRGGPISIPILGGPSAPAASSASPPSMPAILQNFERLSSMGFPAVACRFALAQPVTRGQLEASISLILEGLGGDEGELDEQQADALFENAIDRLGQRAAVDAYRNWQEAQQAQQSAQQADAVVGAGAPVAPPMAGASAASRLGSRVASNGASSRVSAAAAASAQSDSERRLAQAGAQVHMVSRYAWNDEDPIEGLALAAPLDAAVATSRALNQGMAVRAGVDWAPEQDRAHLLARARDGTLIGAELSLTPEAVESLSRLPSPPPSSGGSSVGASATPSYKIGDTLTIIDLVNKVCPAQVEDINEDGSKIYIHYIGWCVAPDTSVQMADGTSVTAGLLPKMHRNALASDQSVQLLGDRGAPVHLLRASSHYDAAVMYHVQHSGVSYTVTPNHRLTVMTTRGLEMTSLLASGHADGALRQQAVRFVDRRTMRMVTGLAVTCRLTSEAHLARFDVKPLPDQPVRREALAATRDFATQRPLPTIVRDTQAEIDEEVWRLFFARTALAGTPESYALLPHMREEVAAEDLYAAYASMSEAEQDEILVQGVAVKQAQEMLALPPAFSCVCAQSAFDALVRNVRTLATAALEALVASRQTSAADAEHQQLFGAAAPKDGAGCGAEIDEREEEEDDSDVASLDRSDVSQTWAHLALEGGAYRPLTERDTVRVMLVLHNELNHAAGVGLNSHGHPSSSFVNLHEVLDAVGVPRGEDAGLAVAQLQPCRGRPGEIRSDEAVFDAVIAANMELLLQGIAAPAMLVCGNFNRARWSQVGRLRGVTDVDHGEVLVGTQRLRSTTFSYSLTHWIARQMELVEADCGALEQWIADSFSLGVQPIPARPADLIDAPVCVPTHEAAAEYLNAQCAYATELRTFAESVLRFDTGASPPQKPSLHRPELCVSPPRCVTVLYAAHPSTLLGKVQLKLALCALYGADPSERRGETLLPFTCVTKLELPGQEYVSLEVSGNRRYLVEGGVVTHNSSKWDEWVEVSSKRIQPKFVVGERLWLRDSVNKEAEAQVIEVAIRDNQLKILVHYVAWSSKWDEWIPANSPRIVSRQKDMLAAAAASPLAALQNALGLSTPEATRLAPAPFALDNRTGVVVAVDLSSAAEPSASASANGNASGGGNDTGPRVLLRVVDETQLHCTLLVWVRLALLRSLQPRAHQSPSHLCPLPSRPGAFNVGSLGAGQSDVSRLLGLAIEAQRNACAGLAERIVRESIASLTLQPEEPTKNKPALEVAPGVAEEDAATQVTSPAQVISPISPLAPLLSQSPAEVLESLPRLLRRFKLGELLPVLAHQCPSQQSSLLSFAQPDEDASAGGDISSSHGAGGSDRARLVATVAQLLLARWQMDVLGAAHDEASDAVAQADEEEHGLLSFVEELNDEVDSARDTLLHATSLLASQSLTTLGQGAATRVAIEQATPAELRARRGDDEDDVPDDEDDAEAMRHAADAAPKPFQLQLVSTLVPPFDRNGAAAVRFTKESVWSVRFYADADHTILLREVHLSPDPASRLLAPFVVPSPVWIVSGVSSRMAARAQAEGKSLKASAVSKKPLSTAPEEQVSFSITPFQHESLEVMMLLAEAVVHIRRMQIGGQLLAQEAADTDASKQTAASASSFTFERSTSSSSSSAAGAGGLPQLLQAAVRSSALSRHCTSLLLSLFESLREFLELLVRSAPTGVPSNLRIRALETMALLLQTHLLHQRSLRDKNGILLPDTQDSSSHAARGSDDEDAAAGDSDDDSLGLSSSSSERAASEMSLEFLRESVLPEARARFLAEKPAFPVFSVYLQRMMELLLAGLRYERTQLDHAAIDDKQTGRLGRGSSRPMPDMPLRRALRQDLPLVLGMETLLLHATHAAAHPPAEDHDGAADVVECTCSWCAELSERKDEAQQAAMLMDLGCSPLWARMLADEDAYPSLRHARRGSISGGSSAVGQLDDEEDEAVSHAADFLSSAASLRTAGTSLSNLLSAFILRRPSEATSPSGATRAAAAAASDTVPASAASSSASAAAPVPSSSALSLPSLPAAWRRQVTFVDRVLSSPSLRARLLNTMLNGLSAPALPRPEIAFKRSSELDEMTSVTSCRHIYRPKPHSHRAALASAAASAASEKDKSLARRSLASGSSADEMGRSGMFQQLVDAFVKSELHSHPIRMRAELGAVTFKIILAGVLDAGAAGLPGPFRQALAEISADLSTESDVAAEAGASVGGAGGSGSSGGGDALPPLLIPSPNSRSQTGDDRNKLVLNPGLLLSGGEIALMQARVLGQLLGIAIRSKCCLNLDLSSVIWKRLLGVPLVASDLASFDYTAWKSLSFVDPASELEFTAEEFDEYLGDLTWTTVLSDGKTSVELRENGAHTRVTYAQRHEYAAQAIAARLSESALLVSCIRDGLLSVLPRQCLRLLSWRELELRVCGRPTVDLAVLEAHTVYSGGYTRASQPIQWFWSILRDFSAQELASFLQFCWARSRLPADEAASGHGSYRMQVNILDAAPRGSPAAQQRQDNPNAPDPNDMLLPTSETCFFNVNIPKYSNLETMRAKIKMALLCSTITS